MTLVDSIVNVRQRIERACIDAKRDPGDLTLVAVTKTVPVARIQEAVGLGLFDFGESYIQEAEKKIPQLQSLPLRWHLVGHLQRNKAKKAAQIFTLIHSLDHLELARVMNRIGQEQERRIAGLLQINIGLDAGKKGFLPQAWEDVLAVLALPSLEIQGVMTVPPLSSGEEARRHFRALRLWRNELEQKSGRVLPVLSMGMSDDFEQAIAEGATHVRLGRAIFGERRD
jgi:pyridoxal phosphate enzyme (YggS family)